MRKVYITPKSTAFEVQPNSVICTSYGSIPVGGRTDSFDDAYSGSISTGGGTANELDASSRRTTSWGDYER